MIWTYDRLQQDKKFPLALRKLSTVYSGWHDAHFNSKCILFQSYLKKTKKQKLEPEVQLHSNSSERTA